MYGHANRTLFVLSNECFDKGVISLKSHVDAPNNWSSIYFIIIIIICCHESHAFLSMAIFLVVLKV